MSTPSDHDDLLILSEKAGTTIVRLTERAIEPSAWPEARLRLRSLLCESQAGMVIDCRELPDSAALTVAPALYELLLNSRRLVPRVEFCAVGKPEQSTGAGSAFLLPPRFETIDDAVDNLTTKRLRAVPHKLSGEYNSNEPLLSSQPGYRFWQSQIGQIALTALVLGLTGGLVSYSAIASFSSPALPRRVGNVQRDARVVVQGSVWYAKGRSLVADAGAVVLAWPADQPKTKSNLTATQLFDNHELPAEPSLIMTSTTSEGRYAIHFAELPQPFARYHVLAISRNVRLSDPPAEATLKLLAEFFTNPEQLLGDHRHAVQDLFIDVNVTKDQNFILSDSSKAADSSGTAGLGNKSGTAFNEGPAFPVM